MEQTARNPRWNLRVPAGTDSLVRRAAAESRSNLTDFVLGAAAAEAERVLVDRTQFVLDDDRWSELVAQLDRPPRDSPGLARLFDRPTVFD